MKKPSLLVAILFTVSLFATAAKAETVHIYEPVTVGSSTLQPGTYDVAYSGNGSDVQVSFSKAHKQIAVAPATLVVKKNSDVRMALTKTDSGSKSLDSIDLKNGSLTFTSAVNATAGAAH
ncbi:hypothetical protein Acid345_4560 [Candidatus Koribacter versatilis Ellin345]|uniref:Uncharacterized protein n=1 Tax=Koribacter versatilis (strain Ellin345) TaxID=204669 RepID=Q1IHU0_KORVE|nr:hypothetical protein [Candidatus Koribacter versatilis]ABF43560.1 hypothetical protein Acid345_4560 [Candidatus Koribacter versatilis Ellin345]